MQLKNNLLVCFSLVLIVVLAILDTATADEDKGKRGGGKGRGGGMNQTCKGEPMPEPKAMNFRKECKKQVGSNGKSEPTAEGEDEAEDDAPKKSGKGGRKNGGKNLCMKVCMWKKQSVLGDDGKYNMDGANTFIKSRFPASAQADIKKGLDECASANGASFSMDNNCEGYQKFMKCEWKNTAAVCGWGGEGKGKGKGKGRGGKGNKKQGGTTQATDDIGLD